MDNEVTGKPGLEVEDFNGKWHISRDFIDHLAKDIERWNKQKQCTIEDIEESSYLDAGLKGFGADSDVAAWSLARVWMDINVSIEFRKSFEQEIISLCDECRSLADRLSEIDQNDDSPEWRDATFLDFEARFLTPCVDFLRNVSLVLRERPLVKLPARRGKKTGEPLIVEKPKRGRPVSKLTIQWADFAHSLREAGEKWLAIYEEYCRKHPRDSYVTVDKMRLAYDRHYPKVQR